MAEDPSLPEKNTTSFYFNWKAFVLGLLLGFIGVIITFFSVQDKRDKVYSALMGCGIMVLVNLYLWNHGVRIADH